MHFPTLKLPQTLHEHTNTAGPSSSTLAAGALDTPPPTPVGSSVPTEIGAGMSPRFELPFELEKTGIEESLTVRILSALDTLYQLGLETDSSRGDAHTNTAEEFRPPTPPISDHDESVSYEGPETSPDIIPIFNATLKKFLILLRAETSFLLSGSDKCATQCAFALFEELLTILKDLTVMNDVEFVDTGSGDEYTGKFRFEGRLLQKYPQGPLSRLSFKPVGTTALNQSLCTLLYKVTGPIQIQGKYPLKPFDGSRKGKTEEVKYKRQISEREYRSFLDAAKPLWGNLSAKKQRRLCIRLVDVVILLLLYWGDFLFLEGLFHLTENDRQKVKRACQDQLKKITLACIDKAGRIKGSPFVMIFQEDAEERYYGDHKQQSRDKSKSGRNENNRPNSRVRERSRSRVRSQPRYGRPASSRDLITETSHESGEWTNFKTDKLWRAVQYEFDAQQHESDCGVSIQEQNHRARKSISPTSTIYVDSKPLTIGNATYCELKVCPRHRSKTPTASHLRQ